MRLIVTQREMKDLARELGVRPSWHEPDEQGLTARVVGKYFDNAGFWGLPDNTDRQELHVIISRVTGDEDHDDGCEDPDECGHRTVEDVAAVNLATLCAWASGYEDTD